MSILGGPVVTRAGDGSVFVTFERDELVEAFATWHAEIAPRRQALAMVAEAQADHLISVLEQLGRKETAS